MQCSPWLQNFLSLSQHSLNRGFCLQSLSVVVPAFNERRRFPPFLAELLGFKEKNPFFKELIVVDDGSTDATMQLLQQHAEQIRILRHAENMGRGAAVRTGIMAANGDFIVVMDADGSARASQIPPMVSALEKFGVVIGCRNLPCSKITAKKPFAKHVISRVFNWYVNRLFKIGSWDVLNGFKGLRKETALLVAPAVASNGWIFDVELLVRAKAAGASIGEIPIEWGYVHGSKMRVNKETITAVFALRALKRKLVLEGALR